jgi:hypothetical protein
MNLAQRYHREFYPVSMDGCKLYLPFYRQGAETSKIYDQSGSGNHGTISGSIPAIRPMLRLVSSGSVTQANMKISAVNGGATASGGAFIDFSAASVLTDYLNHLLVVKDSAGRVIMGFPKAAGAPTGETFGDEILDDTGFDDDSKWTKEEGWTVNASKAVGTTVAYGKEIYQHALSSPTGKLYYRSWDLVTRTGGGIKVRISTFFGIEYSTPATYTGYSTGAATTRISIYSITTFSGTIDNFSVKQVLTPSPTGVTIVSTQGGATYNWLSKDTNFNYNDASGYTYEIYSVPGYIGQGWLGDGVDDRIVHSSLNLGTAHTLHYWLLYQGISGVIHGGAANYHGLRLTPTACGYNVGTTEVTVTHSANFGQPVLFSIDRNGTSVDFYKNGVKIGTTQTLGANTAQVLTDFFRYSNGASYWNGILFDAVAFNTNKGSGEIRKFFDLTRARYGV